MRINQVNFNQNQQKQNLGFGSKIVLSEEVKGLVKTVEDADKILEVANKAVKDGKDYIIKVQKSSANKCLFGVIQCNDEKVITGTGQITPVATSRNVAELISKVYGKAKTLIDEHELNLKIQDKLKDL